MEAKASTKLRPKSFKAKVNISFLDCAACCGPQIIGCYAPNGDHCERPLEIGNSLSFENALVTVADNFRIREGTVIKNCTDIMPHPH